MERGHSLSRRSTAQAGALRWVEDVVSAFGPCPDDLAGPGALQELRAMPSYDGEAVCVASLRVDLVSLPGPGSALMALPDLCGDEG